MMKSFSPVDLTIPQMSTSQLSQSSIFKNSGWIWCVCTLIFIVVIIYIGNKVYKSRSNLNDKSLISF
jgi:uncharacterized membrane protein